MLREMLAPKNRDSSFLQLRESTLACVRLLADSFQCDMKHSEQILIFAETLFDKMKEITAWMHAAACCSTLRACCTNAATAHSRDSIPAAPST